MSILKRKKIKKVVGKKWLGMRIPSHLKPYSHSLKLALYGVNLGLSARFFGGFDRLFSHIFCCGYYLLRKYNIRASLI
jgi:hypothetical protein